MSQISLLFELQQTDIELRNIEKNLKELPELTTVHELKAQHAQLSQKLLKLKALTKDVQTDIHDTQEKIHSIKQAINHLQEDFDNTKDYRRVLDASNALSIEVNTLDTYELQLKALEKQESEYLSISHKGTSALENLEHKIQAAYEKAKAKTHDLIDTRQELLKRKEELTQEIDDELIKKYQKLVPLKNNIALARLDNKTCSACGMLFSDKDIAELKQTGLQLAQCPFCQRMLSLEPTSHI